MKLKATWKKRREEELLPGRSEDEPLLTKEMEDEAMIKELEEKAMIEDFMREENTWCLDCARQPCVCILTYLDLKIETLKGKEEQKPAENWRKRRRSSHDTEPEDAIVAGHLHHLLEADVQQDGWGQPQHHQIQGVEVASRLGGGEAKRSKTILNNAKNTKITLPEIRGEAPTPSN